MYPDYGKNMVSRNTINYFVDVGMAVSFILSAITGIIKFPGFLQFLGINQRLLPTYEISLVHDWSSLALLFLVLVHLLLHREWIVTMTRGFLKKKTMKGFLLAGSLSLSLLLAGCAGQQPVPVDTDTSITGGISDTTPEMQGKIMIEGIGEYEFDPQDIETTRSDIFKEGHFSVFDILVHLDKKGETAMEYHFDESMNTHVIDSINGKGNWWYMAYYDGGWPEANVYRMDHFPYKDKMYIRILQQDEPMFDSMYSIYREEVERKEQNNATVIIPEVTIRGPGEVLEFHDVEVTPHNIRNDTFQPGVVTAIDVIMSLGDKGEITYDLEWFESIGTAEVVKDYFVSRINNDQMHGRCGFVYEEGSLEYSGFRGNHIHIPSDYRTLNSPEYVEWFWICI